MEFIVMRVIIAGGRDVTQPYIPRRIVLTRDVPLLRGILPAGTEMSIVCVTAIATSGPHKSWDVHGLSPDAFEFVATANSGKQEAEPELPLMLPTVAEQDEQDEVELPSFV